MPEKNAGHRQTPKIILACGFLLLCGTLLFAVVMSDGLFQMVKTLLVSGGGSSNKTGGPYSLVQSVGQPNAQILRGGPYELDSGYHGGSLGAPEIVSVAFSSQAVVVGIPAGVPWKADFAITFSAPMDSSTLSSALQVTAQRDKDGNTVQNSAEITVVYDTSALTALVTPASSWNSNTLYALTISTNARSADGLALAPYAMQFQTMFERSVRNVFLDSNGLTQLLVPAQTTPSDGYVIISTNPLQNPDRIDPGVIQRANNKIITDYGPSKAPVAIREINTYNTAGNLQPLAVNAGSVILQYQDDGQGNVLGSRPPIRVATLALWSLDHARNLWLKEPGSTIDTRARTVTASVSHLSVFALIGGQETDVSQVYAFPIPWKPLSGNPGRYGTLQDGITFSNLPSQGTLRIYTLSGELVQKIEFSGGARTMEWFGTNGLGQKVASGVYLWEIRSGDNRNTGKLMIVW